jgi:tetratricopeptide (TPR) repeat protein
MKQARKGRHAPRGDGATSRRNVLLGAALAIAALLVEPAAAQQRWGDNEVALLPAYCRSHGLVASSPDPAEGAQWRNRLGQPYRAIHHYCWGQMWINRAKLFSRSKQDRMRAYNASLPEFEFMLRYTPADYVLLPEILTKRAEALLQLGRHGEAMRDLQTAMSARPDYWPPYALLGDHYRDAGDQAKAREWLEKGLSQAPDAMALKNRLAVLGGGGAGGAQQRKPAPAPGTGAADTGAKPADSRKAAEADKKAVAPEEK